jgi:hypothetical protein
MKDGRLEAFRCGFGETLERERLIPEIKADCCKKDDWVHGSDVDSPWGHVG